MTQQPPAPVFDELIARTTRVRALLLDQITHAEVSAAPLLEPIAAALTDILDGLRAQNVLAAAARSIQYDRDQAARSEAISIAVAGLKRLRPSLRPIQRHGRARPLVPPPARPASAVTSRQP